MTLQSYKNKTNKIINDYAKIVIFSLNNNNKNIIINNGIYTRKQSNQRR